MDILESPLMGEFIGYLRANWSQRSGVDQRRRRLRQLVARVRGVADAAECCGGAAVRDGSLAAWLHVLRAQALRGQEVLDAAGCDASAVAGSARRFLAGLRRELLVCSAKVDRLTQAVEELERLAGPGGDLDTFRQVLRLEDAAASPTDMDVDARPAADARHGREASGGAGLLPVPGAKRKRACCSGEVRGSTSDCRADMARRRKRPVLYWARPHHWPPSGSGHRAGRAGPRRRWCLACVAPGRQWQWRWPGCDFASGSRRGGGRVSPALRSTSLKFRCSKASEMYVIIGRIPSCICF